MFKYIFLNWQPKNHQVVLHFVDVPVHKERGLKGTESRWAGKMCLIKTVFNLQTDLEII